MRVLITGGAGFIGSHVADSCVAAGHEVAVLDDLSSGKRSNIPERAEFFEADIRDADLVNDVFRRFRPEVVCHQAAQASVPVSMDAPGLDAAINLVGGIHVLDAAVEVDTRRIVFASTGGAIYGEVPEGQAADESTWGLPLSPYAIHKLAFEQLVGVYESLHQVEGTILRYSNVYGPRQDPRGEAGVVATFFSRALEGEQLVVNACHQPGDAGCVRDYVFVADVVRANVLAIEGRLTSKLLNCSTGVATETLNLANEINELVGSKRPVAKGAPRRGDVKRSVMDSRRFAAEVGPPTELKEGLAKTLAWYRSVS